ncbi:GNAT family N-acetyltransferase [Pseudofrankia inefficax]|uniref:GCN5-related N-acetyltransferase n=1 Tax=Pseudofrankia inefficax (strain DSM 45817 / CECT 9037 / DDB 130130 / EuI1c) TaxID=298654 RepID=E3IU10_PSEI1|nr:GNAT family N-acetyltransferase [Pseudofrankia inefficax]ADP81203.1 GCN5-related N-acetyltransferase [Pseudofrankia inefficax]
MPSIRAANDDDLTTVADLLVQLYEDECPGIFSGSRDASLRLIRSLVRENESVVRDGLVLDSPDGIIAYGAVSTSTFPRRRPSMAMVGAQALSFLGVRAAAEFCWAYSRLQNLVCAPLPPMTAQVHSLVVHPRARGNGYGELLFRTMEDTARQGGHHDALLYVLAGNPARRLYARLGYQVVPTPTLPGVPALLRYPGIAMRKPFREALAMAGSVPDIAGTA